MGKFNYITYKERRLEKFSKGEQEDLIFDLINAFALANTSLDSALLLQDLLTEAEIKNLAKRLRIAKLLLAGNTHEDIVGELHCSYATITKVRIWLETGGDGFKKVIKKLPKRKNIYMPKRIPGSGYGLPNIMAHYISVYLKGKENKRLGNFVENIREKTSQDQVLKEEISLQFKKLKK